MKGLSHWNYRPFTHVTQLGQRRLPVVCRVAPGVRRFEFQWYDDGFDGEHAVRYRVRGAGKWTSLPLAGDTVPLEDLEDETDYEFIVYRLGAEGESRLKLARTGFVPGTVINYIHPMEREINPLGYCPSSPTIVRLPSGALLCGHDVWAPAKPSNVTQLFRSADEGGTWRYVTDLCPCLWPELFVHRGALYILACTEEYGDLVVSRSDDEGATWRAPAHIMTGGGHTEIGPHKAPVPVVEHEGRLHTAIEFGAWRIRDHQSTILSIDVDADLMEPANWRYGAFLPLDRSWKGMPEGIRAGYIEGNVVVGPDGELRNLLRIDHPSSGRAVLLRGNSADPEAQQTFEGVVPCPVGSNSKFQMARDPVTGKYIAVGTEQTGAFHGRTVLSMAASDDLYGWKVVYRLFDYHDADPAKVGFQYPDWIFSGDDLCVQVRVAFNQADTFHNGNFSIFTKVEDFRRYL